MADTRDISPAQLGLGDMDVAEFRAAAHRVADMVADYLEHVESYSVLPDVKPGDTRSRIAVEPPDDPQPLEDALGDYLRVIEPNITHWQHPGFMAYFSSVASGPGILGEWLATGLNSNVMLWRNAPASTELEEVVVGWMRRMFGLPPDFDGMFTDTASISSLLSVVAARQATEGLDARVHGLAGRPDIGRLRMYCSEEAHFSIEKAGIVAGVGTEGVRRIPTDHEYRLRADLLEAAIREDREAGWVPFCAVATLGTTSSTSVDPVGAMAEICEREKLWLHVDAAYAGVAAIVPEYRDHFAGWERADSIVVNPHKWMFTPFDASLLLFRDPETYREAFSIVPEYARTPDTGGTHNFNEYGIQMGRRFRALKLWMLIRYFGVKGIAARLRRHCEWAREFAGWVGAEEGWELLAPVPFSTVCFRYVPPGGEMAESIDEVNEEILNRVNRTGSIFLSHTKLRDRFTIRVTFGNPRTTEDHVRRCWDLLRDAAARVSPSS
jgi:aromatic-L-amino-acid decarboxylase